MYTTSSRAVTGIVLVLGAACGVWLLLARNSRHEPKVELPAPAARDVATPVAATAEANDAAAPVRVIVVEPKQEDGATRTGELVASLKDAAPRSLYDELGKLFTRDAEEGARVARALLALSLADDTSDRRRCAAILAAWLDSGAEPTVVVNAALAELESVPGAGTSNLQKPCLELGLGLRPRLTGVRGELPAGTPSLTSKLVDALILAASVRPLLANSGWAVAIALGGASQGDLRAMRALTELARNEVYVVRGAAIKALGAIATPQEVLAAFDRTPLVVTTETEGNDCADMFWALHNATNRHPEQRRVVLNWVRGWLVLPSTTEHQEVLQSHLIGGLNAADVPVLRDVLTKLAEGSSPVAAAARRALSRAH